MTIHSNDPLIVKICNQLQKRVNQQRYLHTLSVEKTAQFIAKPYQLDSDKITQAALLHDYAKGLSLEEMIAICDKLNIQIPPESKNHGLLHAKVSRIEAEKEFGITDIEILKAISSHTTGRIGMSQYEEVIFISDYCEPTRKLPNSDFIIDLSRKDLAQGMFEVLRSKISYVIEKKRFIHPVSIEVYNYYQNKLSRNQSSHIER